MINCGTNKYTQDEFDGVIEHILQGDHVSYISNRFDPETANALLRGISLDQSNFDLGVKDFDEIIDFLYNLTYVNNSDLEMSESSIPDYAVNYDQVDLEPYADVVEHGGTRELYDKIVQEFKDQIVERCLLGKDQKLINPDDVNKNLYAYKLELLNKILNYISSGTQITDFQSDNQFTKTVTSILNQFERKIKNEDISKNQDVFKAYTVLAHFDNFITDGLSFINIKPEFLKSGTIGKEMYVSTGPFNYKDRLSGWSEEAGTEDYTSTFVKLLLDYFKVDGVPIGFESFQAVAGKIIEWVEASNDGLLHDMLYLGLDDSVLNSKNGIVSLLERFIDRAPITATLRKVARGIKDNIFDSNLEDKVKKIFLNQMITSVRYAYMAYRIMYDPDAGGGAYAMQFTSSLLQSSLVDKQVYNIQRIIKNRVYTFRHDPELLKELIKKYDIDVKSGKIIFNAHGNSQINMFNSNFDTPYEVTITTERSSDDTDKIIRYDFGTRAQISSEEISLDYITELLEDFTGLVLPPDAKNIFETANPAQSKSKNFMWDAFVRPVLITITASSLMDNGNSMFTGYEYLYRGEEVKLFNYFNSFRALGNFYSVLYGAEYSTVIKNAEGNNLPTSQLRTSVFDVKRYIYDFKTRNRKERSNIRVYDSKANVWKNVPIGDIVFQENHLYNSPDVIGTIAMRSDVKIDESHKVSQQLSPNEVLREAIEVDFLQNLFGTSRLNKDRTNSNERLLSNTSIWLQPIVFSDKRTHFIIEYRIDKIKLGEDGKSLATILKNICSFNPNRKDDISLIEGEIQKTRLSKYELQTLNLINRFSTALNWNLIRNEKESVIDFFKRAKEKLHQFFIQQKGDREKLNAEEKAQILNKLESYFGTSADLYNDSDIIVADSGEIFFNPTLDRQLSIYSDSNLFKNRIKLQKLNYIRDLIELGYVLDPYENPSLRRTFKIWKETHSDWFDAIDETMHLFKAKNQSGSIAIDWTDLDNLDLNSIEIELNPILESYFYADNFLSQQFNDLLFGDVNGYTAKHSEFKLTDASSFLNDMFYTEDESTRLTDMAKRTVLAGASRITFAQGMKYGIADYALMANIEDLMCPTFNFTGSNELFKATDGSTYVHSVFARLQNFSLLDRRVGNQRKKTFANGIDPETGTAWELKHAEYTLTNEYRRFGCEHTDFSYETLYKLMSSLQSDKFGKINLNKYYSKEKQTNSDGENITCTKDIFRYNIDLNCYEKLDRIEQNGKNVTAYWLMYDENKVLLNDEPNKQSFTLNTLYDLDQLFGGAYCSIWNDDLGQFEFSEINQDLLTVIVCEENLKNDFISLASNHSATKVGVRNLNRGNVTKNGNPLKYWEFSTLSYGIQMNPDHDIEDMHGVREMSQMISALIQGGYMNDEVQEIYRMIGEVALDSVRTTIDAVEQENQEKIYEIVGQALLKAFDTNQKDVLGLAQSFIAMANKDLATGSFKTRIPFSANTIKGSFQATITSFLNKDAIRRRYSGMGGVNTPSFGGIQYFEYTNPKTGLTEKLSWLEFVKTVGGRRNADYLLTDTSWNGNKFNNPTIVEINPRNLKLYDTIVYHDSLGAHEEKLDSPEKLYEYKYYNNKGTLYKWTVKPKDFSGSEITFTGLNGSQYSIFDTDLVRIIIETQNITKHPELFFYVDANNDVVIDEFSKKPKLKIRGVTYYNLLRNAFRDRNIDVGDLINPSVLSELFNQAKWDIQNKLLPQLSNNKENKVIPIQECMKPFVDNVDDWIKDDSVFEISSATVNAIEGGMGKMSAKKLGFRKGDTINDVLRKGPDFFKERIKNQTWKPTYVDPSLYDAVLYGTNGKQTLVVVGSLNENSERLDQFEDNNNYKLRGTNYWKGDVDYGDAKGIAFKQITVNNEVFDVVVVDSWDTFDSFYHNNLYTNAVFNYTEDNWKNVLKYRYRFNFDKLGKLHTPIGLVTPEGRQIVEQIEDGDLISTVSTESLITSLNKDERRKQNNFINRRAKDMFDAFNLQLKLIIDRIPSQSMQSFASADVIMLFDTEENTIVFSPFLLWLQGADLDIDKSYTITYEIGEDGRIIVPTKLNRYFSAKECLELPLPNRKVFTYYNADEYSGLVLNKKIPNTGIKIEESSLLPSNLYNTIKEVLKSDGVVYFDTNVSEINKEKLKRLIKLHQDSVNLPSQIRTAGYKNRIVHIMHRVLRDPLVQVQLNLPVDDVMKELSNAIPAQQYRAELYRTWDNPISKFRIQYDNMVGRDVIGISAVSLKAFFAETAYGNLILQRVYDLLSTYKPGDVNTGNEIVKELKKICFAYKFKSDENVPSGIATIVNLNFSKLKNKTLPNISFSDSLEEDKLKINKEINVLQKYIISTEDGKSLNLTALIADLDLYANGNYKQPKNGAGTLSGYTSLATDNAKELKLVKMNATSKFADIHTFLATIGCNPKDVIKFMSSPAFKLIARFAETSIFNADTRWLKLENALNFVRDKECLPIIKNYVFEKILTDTSVDGFLRNLTDDDLYTIASSIDKNLSLKRNIDLKYESLRIISTNVSDKSKRKTIVSAIYELLRRKQNLIDALQETIKTRFESAAYRNSHNNTIDEDILFDQAFDESDYMDMLDDDYQYNQDDYFTDYNLMKEDWLLAYKYVKYYLKPKNKELAKFDDTVWQMYTKLENILDAVQEQRMLGILCGINQGMDTSDYDEYKNVVQIENYINKRYRKYMSEHENVRFEPFNFIKFLNDSEYRQNHIDNYNSCATTYNILDILTAVPHYNAMSKLIATNRYLIQRSVAIEMERDLAQQILIADKSTDTTADKAINVGFTQKFNEKQWSVLRNYVSDLLILKWFQQQSDLEIGLPPEVKIYDSKHGEPVSNKRESFDGKVFANIESISLDSIQRLATFKHLMDTYIIPKLKKAFPQNAFLQDLTNGSIHDKMTNRLRVFYGPSFDLSQASRNAQLKLKYENISRAFNELSSKYLPENLSDVLDIHEKRWKIGDLFFIYNLLVHKDGFGSQSMTRLFEDANTSSDKFVYNKQYYDYLSKLDSREIDFHKLFANELTSQPGRSKYDHLTDLRIRLAAFNEAYKFKSESEFESDRNMVYILDKDGVRRSMDYINADINPSDFTLWFPYFLYWEGHSGTVPPTTEKALKIKQDSVLTNITFTGNSKQIITIMSEKLEELLGNNAQYFKFTTDLELEQMWTEKSGPVFFSSADDFNNTLNAKAFIFNGKIYINTDKNFVDAPMHEFLHVLLAVMKFGGNLEMRGKYYALLDEIASNPDYANRYATLKKEYGERRDSDIKEELLVEVLANKFASDVESKFKQQINTDSTESDVKNMVRSIIDEVFDMNVPEELDDVSLANTDFRTLLSLFGNNIKDINKAVIFTAILPTDIAVREIKDALFKNSQIKFNSECI